MDVEAEQMKAQAQVEEQNKALVRRVLAEGDKKNLEILDEVCASDYKVHFPGNAMSIDLEESKRLWQSFQAAFPLWISSGYYGNFKEGTPL